MSAFDLIETQLQEQLAKLDRGAQAGATAGGSKWIERIEALLDAGDAELRRKKADRIYRELAAERISSDRAVAEPEGPDLTSEGRLVAQGSPGTRAVEAVTG